MSLVYLKWFRRHEENITFSDSSLHLHFFLFSRYRNTSKILQDNFVNSLYMTHISYSGSASISSFAERISTDKVQNSRGSQSHIQIITYITQIVIRFYEAKSRPSGRLANTKQHSTSDPISLLWLFSPPVIQSCVKGD